MLFFFRHPCFTDPGHAFRHLAVSPGLASGFWLIIGCVALIVVVVYLLKTVVFRAPDERSESSEILPAAERVAGRYMSLVLPTENPSGPASTVSLSPDPYGINHV